MSELPKGWAWTSVGDISERIHYGYTASSTTIPTDTKLLRITDIQDNLVKWETVPFCTIGKVERQKYLLSDGDLVFARTGATVGKSYLIEGKIPETVFASYLIRIILFKDIFKKFVYHFFQSDFYWRQISEGQVGTGQPNVNASVLSEINIPLPPLNEQRRIVAKLDSLFARSRRAREELERIGGLCDRYRQAVLTAAFQGELTADWREKNHPNLLLENTALSDSRLGELPDLPCEWYWKTIGQVADVTGGLTKNQNRANYEKKVPYLRVANVYANELRLDEILDIGITETEWKRVMLKPEDLLIVEGNGSIEQIGRVALWTGEIEPCAHQNHLIKVRVGSSLIPKFALYWLLSPSGRRVIEQVASSSAGLHTLSISKVSALPIPLCTTEEMENIVETIEKLFNSIDQIQQEYQKALKLCDRLDQAILTKAFSGQLVPQDPTDEPADVLLDRIRAAKQDPPKAKKVKLKKTDPNLP